jgi:diguanylate cyclase (GGDEF)-like protein
MDADKNGSSWRPDWKKLAGEGYSEIFKALSIAVIGCIGVWLSRGLPIIGSFLTQPFSLRLYELIIGSLIFLIVGFCVDRFFVAKRLRRLSDDTMRDELTGLMNLRAKKRTLPAEMKQARERLQIAESEERPAGNEGLCAIMVDIDNFKKINDTSNYDSGNFVLQQFAELLNGNRKVTDQIFRIGGDEFLILAPHTPRQGGLMYAEKLRQAIRATKFKVQSNQLDAELTICAGVAEMSFPKEETPENFLKRANSALFRAKQHKDRVEVD